MPLFYLHLCNGTGFKEDRDGRVLPSADQARARALVYLRELLAAQPEVGALDPASFVEIEDENHNFVAVVTLADAAAPPQAEPPLLA